MVFAILVLLGRYINYTLDLAGIAGLIIGIGTTADSFVVFFERIKDEIREGRSFRSAVPRGWVRARRTIVSGNAVSFLAAAVLYFLAIGQVKGFAFTLGLTTILDTVVVFLVTWPLVYLASKSTMLAKPAFNGLGAVQQIARERRAPAYADGTEVGVASKTPKTPKTEATSDFEAVEVTEAGPETVEAAEPKRTAALPHHSFLTRLYTGTGAFEVVGRRRLWYAISGAIVAVAILSILIRGFTFGIDFKGGTTVSIPAAGTRHGPVRRWPTSSRRPWAMTPNQWSSSATAPRRPCRSARRRCPTTRPRSCATRCSTRSSPKGTDGKPSQQAISDSAVSATWGDQITKKALIALVVFLVLVSLYITMRYERYMAISALATMCFDLTITAGVYSLVGFEVSPATVIGLLTILGFSLYDTVIVFDKVEENTPASSTPPGAPSPSRPTWRSTRRSCARSTPA